MWSVRGARRRQADERLHRPERAARSRSEDHDGRESPDGSRRRGSASGAESVLARRWIPVRHLHPGIHHVDRRAPHRDPEAHDRADPGGPRRQHLPVRRVREDLPGGQHRRRRDGRSQGDVSRLADAQWYELSQDPAWQEMVGEQSETVAAVIAQYGSKMPGGREGSTNTELPQFRPFRVLGTDIARIQGYGIVTNQGTYTENLRMNGMLFIRTLRSRYPHAKIKSIDTTAAEKMPGGVKILHRGNLPKEYQDVFLGSAQPTRFLFSEEVFEVGAPIAVIAATSEHIGDEAMRAIDVQYEVLPASLDMIEAMKSSTPKQFTSTLDGTTIAITAPLVRGDPNNAKADKVVENIAHKSVEQHVALEITNSLMYWDGDKLNVTYTNQHAHGTP